MVPNPFDIDGISVSDARPTGQKWLAISQKYFWYQGQTRIDLEDAVFTLRSLSQTCRSLRAFTLTLLWSVVHVHTIDQLGRLRETLRVSPSIGKLVRSFCFSWHMDHDTDACDHLPEHEGSLLDLAFRDRWTIWNQLRQDLGLEAEWIELEGGGPRVWGFAKGDTCYHAPGRPLLIDYDRWSEEPPVVDASRPRQGGKGPDGFGEDRLIKTPEQLNDCLSEVIEHLSRLETLGWSCAVTQMPQRACRALAKLDTLRNMCYTMYAWRGTVHLGEYSQNVDLPQERLKTLLCYVAVPLWDLVDNVRDLSLGMGRQVDSEPDDEVQEQDEDDFIHYELPPLPPTDYAAKDAVHIWISTKTIIAAARGGQLRRLTWDKHEGGLQYPFAIRALLPYWVRLEDYDAYPNGIAWEGAARLLRPLLAHASLWAGITSTEGARHDRRLAVRKVQTLRGLVEDETCQPIYAITRVSDAVSSYVEWLEEDEELAQEVTDAWNAVVEQREADLVQCRCKKCTSSKQLNLSSNQSIEKEDSSDDDAF